MTLFILAALAAATAQPAAAPAAPADPHAQHQQQGTAHDAKDCCCKDMAKGGKMACCAKHGAVDGGKGEAKAGEHADHGLSH